MYAIRKPDKRRAVSPVIATVILVAVTITVAVAVSYWMSSIAGQYTGFEKVEIQSGYSTKISVIYDIGPPIIYDGLSWKVTIKLKNTGSAPSTITSCFVNEKPIEEYTYENIETVPDTQSAITWQYLDEITDPADPTAVDMPEDGVTLESGTSATIYVTIVKLASGATASSPTAITFTSGTTVNVKLHSAGGMDYIRLIMLS